MLGVIRYNNVILLPSAADCILVFLTGPPFFMSGAHFMVAISILRYRAVYYPLQPAISRWKLHLVSVFVYVFANLCHVPMVFVCFHSWPSESLFVIYVMFLSAIVFFIPVIFLGITYWKICRELVQQSRKIKSKNATVVAFGEETELCLFQRLTHHRNARTFLISFVIFVCFFMTACPQQIVLILNTFKMIQLAWYFLWFNVVYYFGVSGVKVMVSWIRRYFQFLNNFVEISDRHYKLERE